MKAEVTDTDTVGEGVLKSENNYFTITIIPTNHAPFITALAYDIESVVFKNGAIIDVV